MGPGELLGVSCLRYGVPRPLGVREPAAAAAAAAPGRAGESGSQEGGGQGGGRGARRGPVLTVLRNPSFQTTGTRVDNI